MNGIAIGTGRDGADDTKAEEDYPTAVRLIIMIVALILSMFLASLDMTILGTAIPKITEDFHSLDSVGWYGSAFFLTVAAFQASWGKAYKFFDLKYMFLISIFLFEVGSLICGVAPNNEALIVGRAITGLGAAGIMGGCYSIVAFAVPPHKRPAFTGIMGATFGVASVLGPLLGGVFTDKVSWRWCFYINLPVGGLSAAMILFLFKTPESSKFKGQLSLGQKFLHMDLPGALLILTGVICFLLAMQWGGTTKAWSDPDVYGTLVGFGLIAILFLVEQWWQGERALLLPGLLKKRHLWVGSGFGFFLGGGFFVLLYYLPIYFQSVLGTTAEQSGIRNLALIIAETLCVILSGLFVTKIGLFAPLMIVGSIISTVAVGLVYTLSLTPTTGQWIGYQILAGIGIGICFQAPIMSGQALSKPEDIATTTALLMFFQTMGGALCVSAAQTAFANELIKSLIKNSVDVEPRMVLAIGASELRQAFETEVLAGILEAYLDGLRVAFAVAIALLGASVVFGAATPWINIKKLMKPGTAL
ncbi:putative MFS multidrug transporter [Lojkania enalia]|uniref:MFS multidrug transporter n=1 Tax=Lojkania enalia TaxID=147567 RepID=A0A9P4K1C3_9PLEO|nr:putative MFS multidrug transporter [Didymosphaeria enalia]